MRRLRKENAELREEMEKLRKRNAEIDAMGQVFQGDVIAQVLDNLPLAPHSPQAIFNDLTDFKDFLWGHTRFWKKVEEELGKDFHKLGFGTSEVSMASGAGFGSEKEFWEDFWDYDSSLDYGFNWELMWSKREDDDDSDSD